MSVFNISKIIKARRNELEISREELSYDVCDVSTLARYERGEIVPSDAVYEVIQGKMDRNGERYILPYDMGLFVERKYYDEVEKILHRKDYEELKSILNNLQEGLNSTKSVEKVQYLKRIETIKLEGNDINYVKDLEKILLMSVSDYKEGKFSISRVFNDTELHILNSIAIAYWNNEKKEICLGIYERLIEYFNNAINTLGSTIYNKIMINYSNYLGLSERYKESISIARKAILVNKNNEIQPYMYNYIFNIGWNYFYLGKEEHKKRYLLRAKEYVELSLALGKYMNEPESSLKTIEDFYNDNIINYCSGSNMQCITSGAS